MSRRKQSNPRQIKRSPGGTEVGEETMAADTPRPEGQPPSPSPEDPEPDAAGETDAQGPGAEPQTPPPGSPGGAEPESLEPREEQEGAPSWSGPDELELVLRDGQKCVRARSSLAEGLAWGPFCGSIQSKASSPGLSEPGLVLTQLQEDQASWLQMLPRAPSTAEANVEIHRKDGALWCRLTRPVPAGGLLQVCLVAEPSPPVKAPAHPDIQLLPQQAGMASILATAVVNKDVFPCKDCGIWYRSERNLQAHLLYYCASRQGAGTPAAAAADEKPKEAYPNERVCPFPQCRKSCPSASSLEIHMRSHSGERPFACLICLSAFTTKANCERHLRVHTDTLSGVCHSCGFISTTRDILYSHLVTSHMVCQPGAKADAFSPGPAAATLPLDAPATFAQHAALQHGARAAADRGLAPTPPPGPDGQARAEATNGEAPQNGGGSEPPVAPRAIKVEAEEPTAEPGSPAPSRTPSPRSPGAARVKAELPSPTPGSSPGPGELGLAAGTLFLPQFVVDAGAAPPASEILAKMSELVHSRLQGAAGAPGLFAGAPKGATCFECDITFNNVNNFYVHKRLYCSGRRAPDDAAPARRARAPPAPPAPPPASPPGPGARDDDPGRAATPEPDAAARGSEGSPSPGSGADEADADPRRTLCEACNIRFSRHETYTVHKRYYCASRHDPPPRRPAPPGAPGAPAPAAPPLRTRRRRRPGDPPAAGPAPEPPASPPPPAADGPIDLSKRPRRPAPEPLPALADYHECTACRVSFHSLDAYLAHKKFACRAAPARLRAGAEDAPVACPYCPPNGLVRGDLVEHLRAAHGLRVADARAPSPAAAAPRDSPQAGAAERREPAAPDSSPRPGPPASPAHSDKGVQTPVPNGGHRFCRLCNIRFSSLSTFIAHKKYYCSSHAAEHVK
ncbi:zinc finger protein ZFPM1 [Sorex fumeus]|uniref:zinc finger protein ZFPM1 n=1 Tax=Sorex fumeus TaxID=62283 RepID=UPI0024AE7DEC|nr:zinc finger protein ZFPM1 [Sorex fumeus]